MSHVNILFHQVLQLLPRHHFDTLVLHHGSDRYVKTQTTWNQFCTLLTAQAKGKDSLRDIHLCLTAQERKLFHLGMQPLPRSTLSDANNKRPYALYEDLFYLFLARINNCTDRRFRFKNKLVSLDSTTISLCLSIFDWAHFRRKKGGIKLHTFLDVKRSIPKFIVYSTGKRHDVTIAKQQDWSRFSDSIIVMDRAYVDFGFLQTLTSHKVFFVTRAKKNMQYRVVGQHKPLSGKGIIKDEVIELTGKGAEKYQRQLRLVTYYDEEHDRTYQFLTNIFHLAASTIAALYKARWDIEIFFKWVKQHLKIKSFYGTSENAVLTQVWIAMLYFLLLTYIKQQTKYSYPLLTFTRLIGEMLFERVHLVDLLSFKNMSSSKANAPNPQQLLLF